MQCEGNFFINSGMGQALSKIDLRGGKEERPGQISAYAHRQRAREQKAIGEIEGNNLTIISQLKAWSLI